MPGKRKAQTRRLECHGGPYDGDWITVPHGQTFVRIALDTPLPPLPQPATAQGVLGLVNMQLARAGRTGVYEVVGYKFKNDRGPALRWIGEEHE